MGNYGGEPNYVRSIFTVATPRPKNIEHDEWGAGKIGIHELPVSDEDFGKGLLCGIFLRTTSLHNNRTLSRT